MLARGLSCGRRSSPMLFYLLSPSLHAPRAFFASRRREPPKGDGRRRSPLAQSPALPQAMLDAVGKLLTGLNTLELPAAIAGPPACLSKRPQLGPPSLGRSKPFGWEAVSVRLASGAGLSPERFPISSCKHTG